MRDDDAIAVLVLLAIVVGRGGSSLFNPGRWVWPMPRLPDGRVPEISDGFHMRPSGMHAAADLMYRRRVPQMSASYPMPDNGSKLFEVPHGTVVLAAADARVWSTGRDAHGGWVVLDHGQAGGGRSTVYRHLEHVALPPHTNGKRSDGSPPLRIFAGDVIGTVGYDPSGPQKIRHLHFELRQGATPIDPQPLMRSWDVVS